MSTPAFEWSDEREPHRARTQALLKSHPDLRRYIGRNPMTGVLIGVATVAQLSLAFVIRGQPWWEVILGAWLFGAFIDHALFVMVHECAHDLVFKRRWANVAAALVANIPQFFPSAVSFRHYHLKHHAYQGVLDLDADLPSEWEARLVHNRTLGKAMWMLLFPLFQIARTFRLREIKFFDAWVIANWIVQIAFNAAVWVVLGPKAFVYLAASLFFSIGLHPLGARWIQEHYLTDGVQETYSYYGPLNAVAMNVGHHNEHHDLPSVPWQHLPAIRREAPEFYDTLHSHTSWTKLMVRFVFDRRLSLFSRMTRERFVSAPTDRAAGVSPSAPAK